MRATSDREVALDGAAIAVVSLALCQFAADLRVMSLVVLGTWLLRTVSWSLVHRRNRRTLVGELLFCALCTALGAFNDWSSVDRYHVYRYLVPTDLPGLSSLPAWMLVYWGLILRFVATLAQWSRFGDDAEPADLVRLGAARWQSPALKIGLQLALVLGTRQAIYRLFLDPVWSWAPFAAALGLHAALFPWHRREQRLVALSLVVGPLLEVLYIQVARLHHYELGWLGGVPLWIALWWAVAVLVWRDLAPRLQSLCQRWPRNGQATLLPVAPRQRPLRQSAVPR